MIEIKKILCPVDFSDFSRRALDHAVAVARWYTSKVVALHVVSRGSDVTTLAPYAGPIVPEPIGLTAAERDSLNADLAAFVAAEAAEGVGIELAVTQGTVVGEILREAKARSADLLVMGSHGRTGFERLMLGSVTEKVLRKVTCPVLTVPRHVPDAVPAGPGLFKRILCPMDFSESSYRALQYAMSLAQEADARLVVLHVLEVPERPGREAEVFDFSEYRRIFEESARERLREAVPDTVRSYCEVTDTITTGRSYREILRVAGEEKAELIVMGVQGRGAADLMLFGSTTQHVLRQATCPVLTLRAG
jgi:nucleotide-binding universal stress UspA family protein